MKSRSLASRIVISLLATSLAACAPEGEPTGAEQVDLERALPSLEELTIELPGSEAAAPSGDDGTSQQALVGETAKLYLVTRDISRHVNGAAYVWLSIVEDITATPPSNVEDGVATWGPHTPALSLITYRFTLTQADDGNYHYGLTGKVKNQSDEGYLELLVGVTTPGPAHPDRGWMSLHFDNVQTLDPTHPESGTIAFHYRDAGTHWGLDVVFDDFVGEDGEGPRDALYHYREDATQAGDFAFLTQDDIDEDGSALETWNIRSRWLAGGSGRSDVTIAGGDLGEITVDLTECWNELFQRTFWEVDPAYLEPAEGDLASCVY